MSRIVCIGGATVDRKYRASEPVRPGTSNPVASERSFGGVARNVAENLARLGVETSLVSIVGDDENGRAILAALQSLGIDPRGVAVAADRTTAEYVAVLHPDGELALGLADMSIFDGLTPALLSEVWPGLSQGSLFADCNLPAETLRELIVLCRRQSLPLAIDAVSAPKVMRLPRDLTGIGTLFLNLDEARAFLDSPGIPSIEAVEALLDHGAASVVLTLGPAGLIAAAPSGAVKIEAVKTEIVDATGAGDALIAATLAAQLQGRSLEEAARTGTAAAALTLQSRQSVRPDLSPALLDRALLA
ncbi:carbohydrate kinase family protein [Microvirga roseola]|uniref:carbohydrate kinase family protein n=1 Tax=Microvirga roseola TaxID=2883126 RepID=UPI001E5E3AD5|nr:carbohydrate kinase family protein [Microvirga roseola]